MNEIHEPSILTANTYFWSSNSSASGRRSAESRRHSEVASYLERLGFEVSGDTVGICGPVRVEFSYSESCRNVYKNLVVTNDGARSNITLLRKLAAMDEAERAQFFAKQVVAKERREKRARARKVAQRIDSMA